MDQLFEDLNFMVYLQDRTWLLSANPEFHGLRNAMVQAYEGFPERLAKLPGFEELLFKGELAHYDIELSTRIPMEIAHSVFGREYSTMAAAILSTDSPAHPKEHRRARTYLCKVCKAMACLP